MTYHTSYTRSHAPLISPYSRSRRFEFLLRAMLFPLNISGIQTERMLTYLNKRKPFKNNTELLAAISNCNLPQKCYHALHLFNLLFVQDYKPPGLTANVRRKICNSIMRSFREIEFSWAKLFYHNDRVFLSYVFLLQIWLKKHAPYFLRFLKPIKKILKHETKYQKIVDYLNYRGEIKCNLTQQNNIGGDFIPGE
jgi:hypothetical protein